MEFYFITIYLSLENLKLALFGCPKFKEQVAVLKAANLFFGGGGGGGGVISKIATLANYVW